MAAPAPATTLPDLLAEVAQRPPLGVKDFEALALANNPTLKQAFDLVERAAGEARQAGLYPNPSAGYLGEELRGGSFGGGENGAFVGQTVVLGGKLGLRRRVFEEQRRANVIGSTEQRERLLGEVDQAFYAALAGQELVRLRRRLLGVARDAVQTVHQLSNVGQADAPDVLQAEVEEEAATVEYVAAQRDYLRLFDSLVTLVGKPQLVVSPLAGSLEDWPRLDAGHIMDAIAANSPAVKRAEQAVKQAEAGLRSARREAVPDLRLRAGLLQDSESLDPALPVSHPAGLIGFASVGVDIPIFNRNQGNVAAARIEADRAREEVIRVRLSLERRAKGLLQEYLAGEEEAGRYKSEMIPRATRAFELYLKMYRAMASAYPQVLIAQRTLVELRVRYIQTLASLWMNASALEHFALTGGLEAPQPSGR